MRLYLVDILQDLIFDPSFVELVQSGPDITTRDFMIGLAWIAGWTVLSKLAIHYLRRLFSPVLARLDPYAALA